MKAHSTSPQAYSSGWLSTALIVRMFHSRVKRLAVKTFRLLGDLHDVGKMLVHRIKLLQCTIHNRLRCSCDYHSSWGCPLVQSLQKKLWTVCPPMLAAATSDGASTTVDVAGFLPIIYLTLTSRVTSVVLSQRQSAELGRSIQIHRVEAWLSLVAPVHNPQSSQ
jgi:hypothetical protein